MSKKKKYVLVLFIFMAYAIYDFGGRVFTDGIYSLLVFYLCYVFLSFESLSQINVISLYRYGSIKKLYVSYMKEQVCFCLIYTAAFFVCGMITGVLSAVFDRGFLVSTGALIKFLVISYINLLIVAFFQMAVRLLAGKKNAVIVVSSYIFISMIQYEIQIYRGITPFILHTAYFMWRDVITSRTFLNYLVCGILLFLLVYFSCKKDRKV